MIGCPFLNQQLGDNARFPGISVKGRSSMGRNPDLRRAVAPEDGTILDQTCLCPMARSGNGSTETRQTAANDHYIILFCCRLHM
ncbi:hypothetical protein D3C71_1756500 [compost metagenome]